MHPEVAAVSCQDCQTWMYDEKWQREQRAGQDVPRPPGCKTPCWSCPKIPKGAPPRPSSAVELSEKNVRAYNFHEECVAVGDFPRDAIVRRNARLITMVVKSVESGQLQIGQQRMVMAILGALGGGKE